MSAQRNDRGSWAGWHGDRFAYVDLAMLVTCRGARIAAVTREEPARVVARFKLAEQLDRGIDAGGVFWLGLNQKLERSSAYVDQLDVQCPRHPLGHRLSIPKLVAEWQGVDLRRKKALVLDTARLIDRTPSTT